MKWCILLILLLLGCNEKENSTKKSPSEVDAFTEKTLNVIGNINWAGGRAVGIAGTPHNFFKLVKHIYRVKGTKTSHIYLSSDSPMAQAVGVALLAHELEANRTIITVYLEKDDKIKICSSGCSVNSMGTLGSFSRSILQDEYFRLCYTYIPTPSEIEEINDSLRKEGESYISKYETHKELQ